MPKLRLTIITSSFPTRRDAVFSQAPFLSEFLDELKLQDVEVTVFTQAQAGAESDVLPGVRVARFPWLQAPKALALLNPLRPTDAVRLVSYLLQGRRHLHSHLQTHGADAVLALWAVPGGWLAMQACARHRIPFGVWCLGSDIHLLSRSRLGRALLRKILSAANWRWADGLGLAEEVEALAGKPCQYLATARRLPQPSVPEWTLPAPSGPKWLYVGRLEAVKGIDVLVDAMIEHLRTGHSGSLVIVGDGALRSPCEDRVSEARVGDRITFAGSLSDDALTAAYAQADCVVIPSRNESLPLVFGEALAAGKALLVTDVGDMGRLGREYGVASVVPPSDPRALASALEEAVRHAPPPGSSGRRALLERLDVRRSAREVAGTLRGLSERREARA